MPEVAMMKAVVASFIASILGVAIAAKTIVKVTPLHEIAMRIFLAWLWSGIFILAAPFLDIAPLIGGCGTLAAIVVRKK